MTNIHTSKENGVHQSCYYSRKTASAPADAWNDENFFFDSIPPKEVLKFLGEVISSTFNIKENGTKYCGQMSLYVLYRLNQGDKFTDIV